MPNRKPLHNLNVYGSFGLRPDKAVALYRQRITQNLVRPPAQWDLVKEGLDLFAVRTERTCVELEREQEKMKLEVREQNKLNEHQLSQVRDLLKEDLHNQFIEINAFVRDCAEKEEKASKKIAEELKRQEDLKGNIRQLEEDLEKLENFRGKMTRSVEEFQSFEATISQLVEESEHLSSTKDFIDKCDALMLAQVEISEIEEAKVKEISEIQQNLLKLDNETDLLSLNNFLVELEKAYEAAHSEGIQWEQVLVKSRDFIVDQEVRFNRLIDSTRQLYLLLCKRNGKEPQLNLVTVEGQLDYIKAEIEILMSVLEKAKDLLAEEQSVQGEKGTGERI